MLGYVNLFIIGLGSDIWGQGTLVSGVVLAAMIIPAFCWRHYVVEKGVFPASMNEDMQLGTSENAKERPSAGILPYVARHLVGYYLEHAYYGADPFFCDWRLTDRSGVILLGDACAAAGASIHANAEWRKWERSDRRVRAARKKLAVGGSMNVELTETAIMRVERFGRKFHLAPGGKMFVIAARPSLSEAEAARAHARQSILAFDSGLQERSAGHAWPASATRKAAP